MILKESHRRHYSNTDRANRIPLLTGNDMQEERFTTHGEPQPLRSLIQGQLKPDESDFNFM